MPSRGPRFAPPDCMGEDQRRRYIDRYGAGFAHGLNGIEWDMGMMGYLDGYEDGKEAAAE